MISPVRQSILLGLLFVLVEPLHAEKFPGVEQPDRARHNWIMHCRGCHQMDASGSAGGAPNMAATVAQFLRSDRGRAFLGRVPGVAFVPLPDTQVAELLNWMVQTFDGEHMPVYFQPYSAEEVRQLREQVLVSSAVSERALLVEQLKIDE